MQDELEDNQEDYLSLTHEYWWDLFYTTKVKDNRKKAATKTKNIASSRVAYHYESDEFIRVTRKKKYSTVLRNN